MAGSLQFAKSQLGGNLKGKKIAYLMYDNPAGKEPLPVLEAIAKQEGFDFRVFAVPPPGVEMGAQVLDITQRYRPDFVVTHLFGRAPSVSMKELKRNGYPLRKVVAMAWGGAEADIEAAGGYRRCRRLQHHPVRRAPAPTSRSSAKSSTCTRPRARSRRRICALRSCTTAAFFTAAIHVEGMRNAIKANGGRAADRRAGQEAASRASPTSRWAASYRR